MLMRQQKAKLRQLSLFLNDASRSDKPPFGTVTIPPKLLNWILLRGLYNPVQRAGRRGCSRVSLVDCDAILRHALLWTGVGFFYPLLWRPWSKSSLIAKKGAGEFLLCLQKVKAGRSCCLGPSVYILLLLSLKVFTTDCRLLEGFAWFPHPLDFFFPQSSFLIVWRSA